MEGDASDTFKMSFYPLDSIPEVKDGQGSEAVYSPSSTSRPPSIAPISLKASCEVSPLSSGDSPCGRWRATRATPSR
jgi:hypothetical protein